jgi:hypothetical protein
MKHIAHPSDQIIGVQSLASDMKSCGLMVQRLTNHRTVWSTREIARSGCGRGRHAVAS